MIYKKACLATGFFVTITFLYAGDQIKAISNLTTIPGFLVDVSEESKVLTSLSPLHHGIVGF